jgi:hypothetical protein
MAWHLVTERIAQELKAKGRSLSETLFKKSSQMSFFDRTNDSDDFLLRQDLLSNPMKFIDEAYRSKADLNRIASIAEDVFLPIFKVPEVAKGLAAISRYGESDSFIRWSEWLNYRKFKTSIKKDISEAEFFHAVMTIFQSNGYRHVYILIDEFEDIVELGKRERMEYLSRMRDIVEYNLESFSIVLCVKREAWDKISEAHPAFVERFSRGIELRDLSVDQARNVIANYISSTIEDVEKRSDDPLYPFNDEAIRALVKKSAGVPRVLLELCFVLFEYAANENKEITKDMVDQIDSIRESILYEKGKNINL